MLSWQGFGQIWTEDFEDLSIGATSDAGGTSWSRVLAGGVSESGEVASEGGSQVYKAINTDGDQVWTSEAIDITGQTISISWDLGEIGTMESSDFIRVAYKIDGGSEVNLTNGEQFGDFTTVTATASGITGSSLELVATINNAAAIEEHYFDNIVVSADAASGPQDFYVDANAVGTNDGSSWANAFTDLQSALSAASSGDRIVVADGEYKPSVSVALNGTGNEETFLIPNGVQLFGGFAGGEDISLQSSFDNRDFITNTTILNGDLNGDDTAPVVNTAVQPLTIDFGANRSDNVLHVLAVQDAPDEVVIDGLTIQNAHDDGTPTQYGGGLYLDANAGITTNVKVENCVFRWHRADRGAAIGTYEPDAGAVINVTLLNSEIYQNSGYNYGAYHFQTAGTAVSNNYIINTVFRENYTDFDGAAVMMITPGGDLDIINSLFYENDANRFFGGISVSNVKDLRIINSTVANNYSNTNTSGGLNLETHTSNEVRNSIFWANTINNATDFQFRITSGSLDIDYSLVDGGATNISGSSNFGTGTNLTSDPLFTDAANGDFTLMGSSPALEAGDAASLPADTYDLDGDANTVEVLPLALGGGDRVQGTVDMGAFESLGTTPNYALDFDGTDEYITTTKNSISTTLTVEAWVTLSTLSPVNDINSIASKWNASNRDFSLNWTKSTNTFYAQVFHEGTTTATTATGTFQPVVDTWYHIAMTYDGSDLNLYVDGVLDATAPIFDGLDSSPGSNVWIGSVEQNATGRDWSGQIDEVRIWDVARSPSQINAFKDVELSGNEPDLALYYAFSDGPNATTTTDNSTNTNTGTLTNMDAATDWVDAGFSLGDPYPFTIYDLSVTPGVTDIDVNISVGVDADLYYVIVPSSTPASATPVPTVAQILAGQDASGSTAIYHNNYGFIQEANNPASFGMGNNNDGSSGDDNPLTQGTDYHIFWVGDNAGQYSNVLAETFTTLIPPDVTLTTLSVPSANLATGSTDNLIYSWQLDVTTANATAQGYYINLGGTFSGTDFATAGFKLWKDTDSDFAGATQIGAAVSYDPGSYAVPSADVLWFDSDTYTNGTTTYFFVTVDLDSGATNGNTFNVTLEASPT
ncbi:MAG: LamG-like jellyroll fold domain-containing protein, partial [Marinoscillum sp.]